MHRWGMVIDLDRCTACRACVLACKVENNTASSSPGAIKKGRCINWLEFLVRNDEEGGRTFMPRPCMQCDNPPCTKVCPVSATYKDEEGIVGQIYPRCIGCRYCMNNCPYSVKKFNWRAPVFPQERKKGLNPDVSVRPVGVVEKCTFCHHRWQNERDKAIAAHREPDPDSFRPACAEVCPTKAILFGDLNDRESEVALASNSPRVFRLLEDMGTEPKVFFLNEEAK